MDCIDKAIEKGIHVSERVDIQEKTWEMFWNATQNRKIFLFGAGALADVFFAKCRGKCEIEGIIDNDTKKQGINIRDLLPEAWEFFKDNICISDKSILKEYSSESIVVLICSLNYYEQIADELAEIEITNVFSLLVMETKERIEKGLCIKEGLLKKERRFEYSLQCIKYPIDKKKIVFRAFADYADHEKYISESLLKCNKNLDLVWLVSDLKAAVPCGVRLVSLSNWKKMIYELETAQIWISDLAMFDYVEKRPEQIYIQTKHWASVTLKKFYLDTIAFRNESEKRALWERESKIIDYIITGSKFDTESCKRGFGVKNKFIEIGSPRSDAMFQIDICKKRIGDFFRITKEFNLLLYAPTYRFDSNRGNSVHESRNISIDFKVLQEALQSRWGGNWIILLRLHPSVKGAVKTMDLPDFVINASDYIDSEELCAASDILISDYSSIMFEPAFVRKPVFLFATDRKDYIDKEYDLLIDYDTLPFPIAETNEELAENIRNFDQKKYEENVDAFMDKYGVHEDGHASERAADFIIKLIEE